MKTIINGEEYILEIRDLKYIGKHLTARLMRNELLEGSFIKTSFFQNSNSSRKAYFLPPEKKEISPNPQIKKEEKNEKNEM